MKEVLERIAKNLELIAEEFKASRTDREEFRQRITDMEQSLLDLSAMFGITKKEREWRKSKLSSM